MAAIDEILLRLPFWNDLSQQEKDSVKLSASLRRCEKGQFLHDSGMDCLGMIYLISGEIRTYLLSEEGREITLFHLYDGDPCVFSASCAISQLTFDTLIRAERACELLLIPTGTFSRLTEQNIYVRCFMYELITQRFSTVMWTMQEIIFKGFDRRLASFLIAEYDRSGCTEIRMTHEVIAQRTNSAREVVARMLKRFSADGLVELRRGGVRILAPDALRALI